MIVQESLALRIIVSILHIIVIGLSITIIQTYQKVPRLKQNPGRLVQSIFILQIIISVQVILSQFYIGENQSEQKLISFKIQEPFCRTIGSIQGICTTTYTLLNAFLLINLFSQIRNKNYNARIMMLFISALTFLITFAIVLIALIFQDIDIRYKIYLGDCNINGKTISVLSYISIILLVILLIIIGYLIKNWNDLNIQTEIYKTNVLKFNRKYYNQYLKANVTYGLIFIFVRLIPEILILWKDTCDQPGLCGQIYLVFLAIGDLALAICRQMEPVFGRHFRHIFRKKSTTLEQRLLNPNLIGIDKSELVNDSPTPYREIKIQELGDDISKVEVKIYQYEQNQISSQDQQQDDQDQDDLSALPSLVKQISSIYNSHRKLQNQQQMLLDQPKSFAFILLASVQLLQNIFIGQVDQLYPYHFNKMIHKKYLIQITEDNISHRPTKPSINEIRDKFKVYPTMLQQGSAEIQCISYGQQIMAIKLFEIFNFTITQVCKSLSWQKNWEQLTVMPQTGTVFLSYDGLVSIEIVDKIQKLHLTKGGGLLQLWKTWEYEYQTNRGIFLPVVFGLHSFIIEDKQYSIVLKLNRCKIIYPLIQEYWSNQQILNNFIKQNIIGWITLQGGHLQRRFMAKEVRDGKFELFFQKSDFLIGKNDKQLLISMITKDYPILQQMKCTLSLQFIYTKHSSKRLASLVQLERKGHGASYENDSILEMCKHDVGQAYQFELASKLGYVEVFWDDCWKNDEWSSDDLNKVIQVINERF